MGDGQLRERLPAAMLPRVIHTEPDASVSRAYRRQHPDATVLQAGAEQLPFESASVAAVLGLCVLDVVSDGRAVARELARVLRPGGRVIHWLDMTTVLAGVVDSLWSIGQVPLPNFFSEPSAQEWPQDLWLMPREHLASLVSSLHQAGSPAASPLAQYLAVFSAAPVAVGAPTRELIQLQESARLRSVLRGALAIAYENAPAELREQLSGVAGQSMSTSSSFETMLRSWFTEEAGFRVEISAVERDWQSKPRLESEPVYRSCLVGEQRHLPYLPSALLCPGAVSIPEQETLLELGVFTFVATRLESR